MTGRWARLYIASQLQRGIPHVQKSIQDYVGKETPDADQTCSIWPAPNRSKTDDRTTTGELV